MSGNDWRRFVVLPQRRYSVPKGAVGRRFVDLLASELEGVKERTWNAERFLVFTMVVLQRTPAVKRATDIRARLQSRMDAWEEGKFDMLVQSTVRTAESYLSLARGQETQEQRAKRFNDLVLAGKLRSAVRYITEREAGGVLMPDEVDGKSGDPVADVLRSKHPEARTPDAAELEAYDEVPDFVDLDITPTVVEKVARRLSGSAGPGGTDSIALQHWLLRFGESSKRLRAVVAEFAGWMANDSPPWAAYRALMANRLVALDKCPGVRPVGIGEIFRRLLAKCVRHEAGAEATGACGIDQLCSGLSSGIDGAIHALRCLWQEHEEEEDWGFLLVDARNAFNEGNRTAFLWTVRHRWPSAARFAFNCYRHWGQLVLRAADGTAVILYSMEGVTQGDPLSMDLYGDRRPPADRGPQASRTRGLATLVRRRLRRRWHLRCHPPLLRAAL